MSVHEVDDEDGSVGSFNEKPNHFPEGSVFHKDRWKHAKFLCILTACGLDISSVGAMIVLVGDVQSRFKIEATTASWGLTAYVITFAGFIAFFGRVGGLVGNGVMMSFFTVVFGICSLLCAVVPNFAAFAVFRALQGMAGAGIVPCAYALVNHMFAGPNLQRYFAILSSVLSGMNGVGFVIGGGFGESDLGYKSLFYFLFAASLVTSFVLFYLIGYPEYVQNRETYRERFREVSNLDVIGCLLFISGSVLLVVGLTNGGDSWKRPVAYVPFAISIVLLISFFVWNLGYNMILKVLEPVLSKNRYRYMENVNLLVPKELMFAHNFISVILVTFFLFVSFMSVLYIVVNYSSSVEGNSVIISSIKILPLVIALVLTNATIALKQDILKPKNGLIVGTFISLLGTVFLLAIKKVETNLYWKLLLLCAFLTGVGGALFFSYMLSMAIGDAPNEYKALAGGIVQTAGQFGSEVALSIIVSLLGNNRTNRVALRERYQNTAYFTLAASAISFLVALFMLKTPLQQPSDEENQKKSVADCAQSQCTGASAVNGSFYVQQETYEEDKSDK